MKFVKQSTAVTVVLGPFVDQTDGFTAETALTISQADIRLSKNGGAFAQTNNAAGATHMENGNFSVPLDTTDTNTIGHLRVHVNESGALPVWEDFHVLAANVYDSLFGAATDKLDVNVEEWNTTAVPAEHTAGYPIVTIKDGTGTGEIDTTSGGVLVAAYASGQAPLQPTVAGRTLDVTAGGEAGVDWANVGSPTTTVNLSGTTVKTATDVETDTQDIQSRLPAALSSGRIVAEAQVVGDKTGYRLSATGVDDILDEPIPEAGVFAWAGTLRTIIAWLGVLARNKFTQTATVQTARNDADSGNLGTAAHSDDGTTFTRGEWTP